MNEVTHAGSSPAHATINNINIKCMARISKERLKIEGELESKGDSVIFSLDLYMKVSRITQDMNRKARENRKVDKGEVLYSVRREGAPEGNFFVVINY